MGGIQPRYDLPERECANPECRKTFKPLCSWKKYCCVKCCVTVGNRRKAIARKQRKAKPTWKGSTGELEALISYVADGVGEPFVPIPPAGETGPNVWLFQRRCGR